MGESRYIHCEKCAFWFSTTWDDKFGTCTLYLPPWAGLAASDQDRETNKHDGCSLGSPAEPLPAASPRLP